MYVCMHGHHYDQKSSYVVTVQLIGNAPGGAIIMIDLGAKQWEAPLNYCMEYEVVCWVCTIAPT